MTGAGVAPMQVGVQGPGLHGVVGVVGVGDGELPQRSEVGLDRVRPPGVGRGEAQLDAVLLRPSRKKPLGNRKLICRRKRPSRNEGPGQARADDTSRPCHSGAGPSGNHGEHRGSARQRQGDKHGNAQVRRRMVKPRSYQPSRRAAVSAAGEGASKAVPIRMTIDRVVPRNLAKRFQQACHAGR